MLVTRYTPKVPEVVLKHPLFVGNLRGVGGMLHGAASADPIVLAWGLPSIGRFTMNAGDLGLYVTWALTQDMRTEPLTC
jgi:hypothetical protein